MEIMKSMMKLAVCFLNQKTEEYLENFPAAEMLSP